MTETLSKRLDGRDSRWMVTGVAGFIGSNILETLLKFGQRVTGLDNFATGHRRNLEEVERNVGTEHWRSFRLVEGSITDEECVREACEGADYVLHQAALGSVPRSINDPFGSHEANVTGFLRVLIAARDAGAKRMVYASSSSVYGDDPNLPKLEGRIGNPLSPYAATKFMNEVYAATFTRVYGIQTAGLRYFNVFGPRQDPEGPYAAVIPKWIDALLTGEPVSIYGDGETSRDFCYVANAVQANILAALAEEPMPPGAAFNVALNQRTTLNALFGLLRDMISDACPGVRSAEPIYREFRAGDVRHSLADIGRAREVIGYEPSHTLQEGLAEALPWYLSQRESPATSIPWTPGDLP